LAKEPAAILKWSLLLQTPAVEGRTLRGSLMSTDHPDFVSGSRPPGSVTDAGAAPSPVPGCQSWCDGWHGADDEGAAYHGRIVARRDGETVALSSVTYYDPAETGSTVIILDLRAAAEPTELEEADAIRLLGVMEASGDGPSWLAGALRSALDLLDPYAGWNRGTEGRPEIRPGNRQKPYARLAPGSREASSGA